MVRKALGLLVIGGAIGFTANRAWRELRKPAPDQFPWLRARMNDTVNPWLMERNIPGSATAEVACLEHVGRKSGTTFFTPVHPTIRGAEVLVPAPLGVGSQWARNILEAGRARLQFHEKLYELDRPELITVAEAGLVPSQVAGPFDHMGWRYLRMHLAATVPGTFATHGMSMASMAGVPVMDQPLEGSYEIPVEPRMVERPVETT
jgi:hypothetical protein